MVREREKELETPKESLSGCRRAKRRGCLILGEKAKAGRGAFYWESGIILESVLIKNEKGGLPRILL